MNYNLGHLDELAKSALADVQGLKSMLLAMGFKNSDGTIPNHFIWESKVKRIACSVTILGEKYKLRIAYSVNFNDLSGTEVKEEEHYLWVQKDYSDESVKENESANIYKKILQNFNLCDSLKPVRVKTQSAKLPQFNK